MSTQAPPQTGFLGILPRARPRWGTVFGLILLGLLAVWLVANFIKDPSEFLTVFLIGVTLGALYGLIALGYTLVYGILELINFAHGDLFMLCGMVSATFMMEVFDLQGGRPLYVLIPSLLAILVIAMAFGAATNTTIELIAYRRLRGAPRLAPLITAVAMSFILQGIGLVWKGARPVAPQDVVSDATIFNWGGVSYTWNKLVVLIVTAPVLVVLIWLVQRTRQGKAMRAVAQDGQAAAMMGINVNRTISFTFALGGALAGVAGLLFMLYPGQMRFDTGFQIGLIAFTAAVLGGIGNLAGAVAGGMVIGLIQAFNEGLTIGAPGPQWTQSLVFSILILILVFRPEGLLGERTPEGQ